LGEGVLSKVYCCLFPVAAASWGRSTLKFLPHFVEVYPSTDRSEHPRPGFLHHASLSGFAGNSSLKRQGLGLLNGQFVLLEHRPMDFNNLLPRPRNADEALPLLKSPELGACCNYST
jgi:hypothetical protein